MEEKAQVNGTAGASARREGERRRENRERRVRERHPRIGGLLVALQDTPQHERAWGDGADGEEAVAASLEKHCAPPVCLLHDRRLPGTRTNIDHLAVAPSGVWVIDAKKYKGKVEVRKPLFGQAKLLINGRDEWRFPDSLGKQVAAVKAAVGEDIEVRGAFCLVDADLPLVGTLTFRGYPLLYRKKLAKKLNAEGSVAARHVHELAAVLAGRFPPA